MITRWLVRGVAVLGLSLMVGLVIVAVAILGRGVGWPVRWELPPGYRGWVVVRYEDPSCPELGRDGIYWVVVIPPTGHACTASASTGRVWRYYRYEYVHAKGMRTALTSSGWKPRHTIEVWGITSGQDGRREIVFIGTEEALNRSWGSQPRS